MKVWPVLHNGLKRVFFSKELEELGELREQRILLRRSVNNVNSKLESCNAKTTELNKSIDQIKVEIAECSDKESIPAEYQEIAEELNKRYPQVSVTHNLPILIKDGNVVNVNVKVQNFIEEFYELQNKVKRLGFTLETYKEKYPEHKWDELVNKLAFDIYKHTRRYVKYKYDVDKYGFNEYWQLPILTHYLGEGDCEDSSNLLLSWFKAAGLPAFAFRNTCGMTKIGGHSTVYAFDFKYKSWRHMEATSQTTRELKDFYSLPSKKKPDQLHIVDVWWSFNWEYAWHKFETAGARKTMPRRFTIEAMT